MSAETVGLGRSCCRDSDSAVSANRTTSTVECGDEFELAETVNGTLVGVIRTQAGHPATTFSTTRGQSFSARTELIESIVAPSCQLSILGLVSVCHNEIPVLC